MRRLRQRRQQLLFPLWQQQQRLRRRLLRPQRQMHESKAKSSLERLQRLRLRQGGQHQLQPLRQRHRRRQPLRQRHHRRQPLRQRPRRRQPLMVGRRRRGRERILPRHRQGGRSAAGLIGRRAGSRVRRQRDGMQISPSG